MAGPEQTRDLVIGIDSSTSATKAIAWDRAGKAVAEGRAPIAMSNPEPGWFEQDPAEWWSSTVTALNAVTGKVDPGRIAALAISNQRETIGFFDADGQPLRAGMLWLDERAKAEMRQLAASLGAETLHKINGKPVDITQALPLYPWLKAHEPELWDRFDKTADVNALLTFRLTGEWATPVASADPLGLLDMEAGVWSDTILNEIGLDKGRLSRLVTPGAVMGEVHAEAARETGLRPGTLVVAGGGDGQCAGTGTNVLESSSAYLNIGTALVSGCYSRTYGYNNAFRTMRAIDARGYIFESCMRTGTYLVDWIARSLFGLDPASDSTVFPTLEREATASPVGANGLMVVPYWSGVMTPWWDMDARGVFAGFNAFHTRGDMYRAVLEGLAMDQAVVTAGAEAAMGRLVDRYVAIGGGASSDLWCHIFADASGRPVDRSTTIEASALGAGMAAAAGAGWFSTMKDAAEAMAGPIVTRFEPDPVNRSRYEELVALYRELWPALSDWNRRLARFAEGGA